jgi:predicted alpha/beta-hydrolase family hydrolase
MQNLDAPVVVPTPAGDARITRFPTAGTAATPRRGRGRAARGAGGGIEAGDLQALAAMLPAAGVEVLLVEQPWRVAGKRLAPAPKTLDVGWRAVLERIQAGLTDRVPVIVGGRSAGARVACRTGAETGAAGVLALAFPLHPPGKPEKSRGHELLGTGLPTLVVQGAVDTFGTAAEFPELPASHRLVALPAGGHEFTVRKTQEPVLGLITDAVTDWIGGLV